MILNHYRVIFSAQHTLWGTDMLTVCVSEPPDGHGWVLVCRLLHVLSEKQDLYFRF